MNQNKRQAIMSRGFGLVVLWATFCPPPSFGQLVETGNRGVPPPPPAPQSVIYEAPPPVVVGGKPADEMNDDEIRDFLSQKIIDIEQGEKDVELVRVAPGYAVSLIFEAAPMVVVLGDPAMLSYKQVGKIIVIAAKVTQGDTSMQVVLPGYETYNYHVFIATNYKSASSSITVRRPETKPSNGGKPSSGDTRPDSATISRVIADYDALIQEKSIYTRDVRRIPIGRKSNIWGFDYYYWYVFKDGTLALSFSLKNLAAASLSTPPDRLRLQIGNMRFTPNLISFPRSVGAWKTATGFIVFYSPPFSLKNSFEIIFQ